MVLIANDDDDDDDDDDGGGGSSNGGGVMVMIFCWNGHNDNGDNDILRCHVVQIKGNHFCCF